MSNRNLVPAKTIIFKKKLEKILERLEGERTSLSNQTKEALTAEAARLIALFYQEIRELQFKNPRVLSRTSPSVEDYNTLFTSLSSDLNILFSELENLESVVVEQFNTLSTQANRINSRVKNLSSKLLDLKLYSKIPIKNTLFISDSFNNTLNIDTGSKLLNSTECNLNNSEGIVTLPIDFDKTKIVNLTLLPLINSNSNGRAGNNQELNIVNINNSLTALTDGNSDTWFEYERVVKQDDGIALVLDLSFNLNKEEVINYIRINPNNFGTKTEIEIIDILSSVDGRTFKSIKDEIQLEGTKIFDEENVFKLAPSTSKFAGQGIFSFTPRYAKYINIKLKQNSPYLINTLQGEQFRYAIGLRDIEITQQAYKSTGELVSLEIDLGEELKKIALKSTGSIIGSSELGSINYQVSIDNGASWIDINPLEQDGITNLFTKAKEVININTEDTDAIKTESPVTSLRYKLILKRNSNGFNEQAFTFVEDIGLANELKTTPLVEPWIFQLEKNPIPNTISVLDTNFGSRGANQRYKIGQGTGNRISFKLPWDNILVDKEKTTNNQVRQTSVLKVYVGGEEWEERPGLTFSSPEDKVFCIRRDTGNFIRNGTFGNISNFETNNSTPGSLELQFGDGTNGKAPEVGSLIEASFSEERLFLVDESKSTELAFLTGATKEEISLFRKGELVLQTIELTPGSRIHNLNKRNIVIDEDYPMLFTNLDNHFVNEVPFVNGQLSPIGELTATGDYSVDKKAGIIYSFDITDSTPGVVSFFYQENKELISSEWEYNNTEGKGVITLNANSWEPKDSITITVASGVRQIFLPDFSVQKDSIVFSGADSLDESINPFLEEVEFINGAVELSTAFLTEETIPTLTPVSSVATFQVAQIITGGLYNVSFTDNSIFTTKVNTLVEVNSIGKYFIDTSTRTIHIHTGGSTISSPGKIKYFTRDLTRADKGLYSIDYANGAIYLQRPIPISGITLSYKYSEYFARYNIARKVSSDNFIYNNVNKTIQLNSTEIQIKNNLNALSSTAPSTQSTYQVNYKFINSIRKNIQNLEPFFTPIVRDIVLQVIPSSLL